MSVEANAAPSVVTPASPPPVAEPPRTLQQKKLAARDKGRAVAAQPKATPAPAAVPAEAPSPATPPADPMQAATPAASQEPAAPEKPQDERISRAFSQLHQKEKELTKGKKALDDERRAHAQKLADADAYLAEKKLASDDPVAWLEKHGGGKETYHKLTKRMLNGGAPPVEETLAEMQKRLDASEAARAEEKKVADEQAKQSQSAAASVQIEAGFAPLFDAQDRQWASYFGVTDLNKKAREYSVELQAGGESELTFEAVAGKIKAELKANIDALKANDDLRKLFVPEAPATSTPKPAPSQPGPKPAQATSLNNAMPATTDVNIRSLPLKEKKRLVHRRARGG